MAEVISNAVHLLDGGASATDTYDQGGDACGWLLTLRTTDGHANSRAQVTILGVDGGGHGARVGGVAGVDLVPEQAVRIYVPWPSFSVTWRNGGAPGEPVSVQSAALPVGLAEGAAAQGRYLYGSGDYQGVIAGGVTTYPVPVGATHYRIAWQADPGGFDVTELETGGAVTGFWKGTPTRTDTRLWTPLDVNRNPAGGALIGLELAAGGPVQGAVQWQYDLWFGMEGS